MQEFPAPDNPLYAENLYSIYKYYRENDPVHRESILSKTGYSLYKYEDVYAALKDKRIGSTGISEELITALEKNGENEFAEFARAANIMVTLDNPEHSRIRKVLHSPLSNISIESLSEQISMIVENLLNNLSNSGTVDLVKEFSDPLPYLVVAKLLGVPDGDYTKLKQWSEDFALVMDTSRMMSGLATTGRTIREVSVYLQPIIEARKSEPRDDVITALAIARYEKQCISDAEMVANFLFFLAANLSTGHIIGNGVHALLSHPDQLEQLRSDPQLSSSAVDEILRYDCPFQVTGRLALKNICIRGQEIPEGTRIRLVLGSANRDPDRFESPDVLKIDRQDNRHVAFGGGIHYCLGASMGKLECEIAIDALLERYPHMYLNDNKRKWIPGHALRGLTSLPVTLR